MPALCAKLIPAFAGMMVVVGAIGFEPMTTAM